MRVYSPTKYSRTFPDLVNRGGLLLALAIAGSSASCGGGGGDGGTGTATLTWDAVAYSDLGGYRIYYGFAPGAYVQPIGSGVNVGNVTTITVTGLSGGTRYYFVATAFDGLNNESLFSNEVFKDIR